MKLIVFSFLLMVALSLIAFDLGQAYHKHKEGHVKIKVWRGPSHGYKKHKYAPFGYHFEVDEKGHH